VNHAPKRFVIEDGKLVGWSSSARMDPGARQSTVLNSVIIPCDDVILAIGQENAFPWIERDLGMEFGDWDMRSWTRRRCSPHFRGLLRRDARGAEEHHLAVAHGHQARSRFTISARTSISMNDHPRHEPGQSEDGMSEWSYHNDYNPSPRQKMSHVELTKRFESLDSKSNWLQLEQTVHEVQRCLNCDVETAFNAPACIECDACIDICPVQCLTITSNGDEADLRARLSAPATISTRTSTSRRRSPRPGGHGQRRERLRALRLCAERCPTPPGYGSLRPPDSLRASANFIRIARCRRAARTEETNLAIDEVLDQRTQVNDFSIKLANVNGTGSASANSLLMQAIFRMGIPSR